MADALLNRLERNSQQIHQGNIEVTEGMVSGLIDLQRSQNGRKASASLDVDFKWAASAHGEHKQMPYCLLPADLLPQQFCKL